MTTKILTAAVVGVLLVASVAFVGPALAHGAEPTAPTDEPTANDTWTDHPRTTSQGAWPSWMADHMTDDQIEWMESHVGDGPQYGPSDQHHTEHGGPNLGNADGADRHDDTPHQPRWGGGYANGC